MKNSTEQLFQQAKAARENAYCPYSGHKVGAALLTSGGEIFVGCNVENSSYGATQCAERVAIQNAVSKLGKIKISEILVVTDADPAWPPCGLCRQVIAEFGPEARIHISTLKGEIKSFPFSELFPHAFTPQNLGK